MDAQHIDTHESSGGIWSVITPLLGIGFAGISLLGPLALVMGGFSDGRSGPPKAPAAAPAAAAASGAMAGAPAAPAASATVTNGQITLKPGTDNPLTYDVKAFTVKAGEKLKIIFDNKSILPQPHNVILGKPGTKDKLIAAITAMITDPNAMAKSYTPDSPDIIAKMPLVNPGQSGTLEITAPAEKGDYPYMCTFPGHAPLMNGIMKVE